ncbi:cell division protein FtsL [Candidatus Pelagibacter sp.]|nr:cell division protein FtsL [Candidatus Pelagibacter sp.]
MIKFIVFALILSLIVSTALIKNSTKDLDDKIYSTKENLLFLENRFKDAKLEFDYLSSSEKLLEYQLLYFENSLQKKLLKELNILEIIDNELIIKELTILGNKDEQ